MGGIEHLPPWPGAIGDIRVGIDGAPTWGDDAIGAAALRAEAQLGAATRGIPPLTPTGHLPAGIHQASLGELTTRFGHGPARFTLLEQLAEAAPAMQAAGVRDVLVGGSFVTSKAVPGDLDLAVRGGVDLGGDLFDLRTRMPDRISIFGARSIVGNAHTIPNHRAGETFTEFFQLARDGSPRGIVQVSVGSFDEGVAAIRAGSRLLDGGAGLDDALRAVRALVPKVP